MARNSKDFPRYQAIGRHGIVIATGKRLCDVEGFGVRVIVDYGNRPEIRFTIQNLYPHNGYQWAYGTMGEIGSRIVQAFDAQIQSVIERGEPAVSVHPL